MSQEAVKVLGTGKSPFSRRVEIALKLKGVPYEYVEEDLKNKSPLLLESNPVHKKIPVLIHNGKSIAESLVILEYIDETWKTNPILPEDSYERAQARFWSKVIDEKISGRREAFFSEEGERNKVRKEIYESLKMIESELKGKRFFGGETIGMLDIAAINLALWLPAIQEAAEINLYSQGSFPLLDKWADELMRCSVIRETLPSKDSLVDFFRTRIVAAKAKLNTPASG